MADRPAITCHALRVKQNDAHPVYLFALTAEQLQDIADISRLERTSGTLVGYQRGIAKQHVDNIAGKLTIPTPGTDGRKPAWIVDGQQRTTALANIKNQQFPVPIAAFIADTVDIQRDQFIRINSVHPLDKSLVTELLPEVSLSISP